jgi:hypothetical protein
MKKLLLYLFTFIAFISFNKTIAQSYSIEKDTIRLLYNPSPGGVQYASDTIVPPTTPTTLTWRVISHNLPPDWTVTGANLGICDNHLCYNWGLLWPTVTKTSDTYSASSVHDFHLQISLVNSSYHATTAGTYYVVVRLSSGTMDTNQVYAISYTPTAVASVSKSIDEVSLYPNPTANDINVVYNAAADIKTISVYSIIGKAMAIYKPISDNSANLSLENVPTGVYFVRLENSRGEIVATRKFTKQ